jgi:hypothetical protein
MQLFFLVSNGNRACRVPCRRPGRLSTVSCPTFTVREPRSTDHHPNVSRRPPHNHPPRLLRVVTLSRSASHKRPPCTPPSCIIGEELLASQLRQATSITLQRHLGLHTDALRTRDSCCTVISTSLHPLPTLHTRRTFGGIVIRAPISLSP